MLVLTRPPGATFATDCLLTFVERRPIDPDEAARQHAGYRRALEASGCRVVCLPALPELPDSVFVEDTAVVLPEVVVLCRPGAEGRRAEVAVVAAELEEHGRLNGRPIRRIEAPATLEGGDVLRLGRRLFVGRSSRTDAEGIRAFAAAVEPHGYRVAPVEVREALHLKTACSALDDGTVLVDPARVDPAAFRSTAAGTPVRVLEMHPDEPAAANVFRAPGGIVMSASGPRTAERLEAAGYTVRTAPLSEIEKAEGGPTCLGLPILRAHTFSS